MGLLRPNTLKTEPPLFSASRSEEGLPHLVLSTVVDRSGSTEFGVRHRFQSGSFSYQQVAQAKPLHLPEQNHQPHRAVVEMTWDTSGRCLAQRRATETP